MSPWGKHPGEKPGEIRITPSGRNLQLSDLEDLCRRAREAGAADDALVQTKNARFDPNPFYISVWTTKTSAMDA